MASHDEHSPQTNHRRNSDQHTTRSNFTKQAPRSEPWTAPKHDHLDKSIPSYRRVQKIAAVKGSSPRPRHSPSQSSHMRNAPPNANNYTSQHSKSTPAPTATRQRTFPTEHSLLMNSKHAPSSTTRSPSPASSWSSLPDLSPDAALAMLATDSDAIMSLDPSNGVPGSPTPLSKLPDDPALSSSYKPEPAAAFMTRGERRNLRRRNRREECEKFERQAQEIYKEAERREALGVPWPSGPPTTLSTLPIHPASSSSSFSKPYAKAVASDSNFVVGPNLPRSQQKKTCASQRQQRYQDRKNDRIFLLALAANARAGMAEPCYEALARKLKRDSWAGF